MGVRTRSPVEHLSRRLAGYVTGLSYEDLPRAVVEKAKYQLTYFFGLAFSGYSTATSRDARALARVLSPNGGTASVIGESFKVSPIDAAFTNCSTVNGSGLDDLFATDGPAIGTHPGLVTQMVAWALGEQEKATGRDLITAVVAGYELAAKLGALVWAPTAPTMRRQIVPFGPFGPTAVAAKLLGLSTAETATALGYAANFAMGVSEGPVISHYYGLVCRNGIMAALLGRTHAYVEPSVLEGEYGFFRTFFGENPAGADHVVERLETARRRGEFDILNTSIKTHPGTGMNIVPISLMLQLVQNDAITADTVESIELHLPAARAYHTVSQDPGPYSSLSQATHSLPFMFAVVLLDGWLNPARYEQFADPRQLELARRVRISFEPDRSIRYARIRIVTADGREHSLEGDQHAFELPPDRLGWLQGQSNGLVPTSQLTTLAGLLGDLENVSDVSDVMACTTHVEVAKAG